MRFLVAFVIAAVLQPLSFAQNVPPPWPQIPLDSCPALAQSRDPSQRTWKHGQAESESFAALRQMLQAKNYTAAADGSAKFAEEYPDSDYRETALILEIAAQGYLKNQNGVVKVAEQLVRLPLAESGSREVAFVTLCDQLSPYVRPDDADKERKLSDLEKWTRCGEEALAARLATRTPNMPQDAFENTRKISENALDRTAGFVAYMRQDYTLANAKLEAASKANSQDALTYLWLSSTEFFLPVPDSNSGVFYLARWANLAPQGYWAKPEVREASAAYLKQMYKIVHGSEKGLPDVMKLAESNTIPPPGFNVMRPPPKEKHHHYVSAIAAAAIVGLLIYGVAAHPNFTEALGHSLGQSFESTERKLMIFGGPNHATYLGCLSCEETARDSVLNEIGQYGSPYRPESIWNHYQQFGSPYSTYSACNGLATDPPVIVDQDGTAYGRLTTNRTSPKIGAGVRFYDWLASTVCQN
jgi:hypothetical protein